MKFWLIPFSILYSRLMALRNKFYDWRLFRSVKVDAPVISVGNVTVGGTGKTPVLLSLVEKAFEKTQHVGVVSRGYKRNSKGVLEVELGNDSAKKFGDEPALIKNKFPKLSVFVGERRVAAARSLLNKDSKAVIFADDALQHRRLKRDLNVVLVDAFDEPKHYRVLPWGMGREKLRPALRRADYVVITKANLVAPEVLQSRKDWLGKLTEKPVLQGKYVLDGFVRGDQWKEVLSDKVYVVSAVGRPQSIDSILENKVEVVKHKIFMDHHAFTDLDVEGILDEASQLGARWIACTEKDWVKLRVFKRFEERLWVIKLKVKLEGETSALYEDMHRLIRARS